MLVENAIWALFPLVLGRAADSLTQGTTQKQLLIFAGILLGIAATKGFFLYWKRWILITISRDVEYDLRQDLYEHLQKQSSRFYSQWRIGDLMSRSTNDMNAVRMMGGPAFMYVTNAAAAIVFAIVGMAYLNWRITLLLLAPIPVVAFIVSYFGREIHTRFERIQSKLSDLTSQVQENITGVQLIRAFTQEQAEEARFENTSRDYISANQKLIRIQGMFWPTLEVLMGLAFLFVLWLGGRAVLSNTITVGSFIAYVQYMFLLTWPMIALGDAPMTIRGDVEFRNLRFSYNGVPVLQDINLKVPSGETLAIVGPTGSGKTTLINLLGRLYDAPPGSLLIDGLPVQEFPLDTLRQSLGYVPQETFLFTETLSQNIALGAQESSQTQVADAADIAGLSSDVVNFPKGYDTRVGERGITLSGGQKQRTAIARAVMRDPRILILDDALSSVDTITEERILRHLKEVMRDRTSIIISHRVSTVQHADQIVVLSDGRIVERGTHNELLTREGYYFDLYQKQLLEEELERE
jgi:ATP-binding cassette subfamily B protein